MNQQPAKSIVFPGIIFLFIGLNFCIVAITVIAAGRNPSSFAIEPDYDRKALRWEETAQQLRQNQRLAWTITIDRADASTLAVTITDAAGRPLDSATITAEAFHHAHARDKMITTLTPTSPGQYTGTFAATTPGLWEFHFTVQRGPQKLTQTLTRTLAPQTPPLATEPHP